MQAESTSRVSSDAPTKARSLWARVGPRLGISVVLGVLFAWLAQRGGLPLVPSRASLAAVRWELVLLSTLLLFVLTVFRATRWRYLIAPVKRLPLSEVILVNWIGFFAIFALPLRLGELARPAVSKLRAQIPISVGLGTVAVERVLDGALTSLCVAWALWALPRREVTSGAARLVPAYASVVLAVFLCAMLALAAFLWKRELATKLVRLCFGIVSPRLAELLAQKVDGVAEGIRSIGDARLALGFAFETVLYWSINAVFMWVLGLACGLPMELGHAVAVMGVLALGILLPGGPGLFGSFQISVSAALSLYFEPALVGREGAAFVFLLYLLNALMMTVIGVVPLLKAHIPFSALLRARATDDPEPTV